MISLLSHNFPGPSAHIEPVNYIIIIQTIIYFIYSSFSPPLHLILPLELISLKDFLIITKLHNLHSQLF